MVLCACSDALKAEDQEVGEEIWIRLANSERLAFNVEMAVTPSQQRDGLMYRTELPEYSGMLFLFGDERPLSFWMKNTFIPLDILFLKKDGTIHHIHHMARPQDESHITATFPSAAVLEINGGTSDALGISEGDVVIHSFFNNTHL